MTSERRAPVPAIARMTSLAARGRRRRAKAWRRMGSCAIWEWSSRLDTRRCSAPRAARPPAPAGDAQVLLAELAAGLRGDGQGHLARLAAAGVAVAEVPLDAALVAHADGVVVALGEDRPHPLAALAADELGVLLLETPARPEERALDLGARHAEALAELVVGEALELAHD